jgi:nicotinate-nucleotide pyrophosphorylase (carboxylating)
MEDKDHPIMPETELHPNITLAVRRALEEDIGAGDATTNAIVPPDARMAGQIVAKQTGIVAGLGVARLVFRQFEQIYATAAAVEWQSLADDGDEVEPGQVLARLSGPARTLLTVERTALNILGRMSGIATLTHRYVQAVAGTGAVILDTRKTAPGLRALDKLAVRLGGGQNHRAGLYDMILIKDNHIDFAGSLPEAVHLARLANTGLEIEIEARTLEDVAAALELRVERILLDNMPAGLMRQAVALNNGRAKLEASGNITLENVRQAAETGVDYISTGALTHSPQVFDVSLKWISTGG